MINEIRISGPRQGGKSTVLMMLYREFSQAGYCPVVIYPTQQKAEAAKKRLGVATFAATSMQSGRCPGFNHRAYMMEDVDAFPHDFDWMHEVKKRLALFPQTHPTYIVYSCLDEDG